MSAVEQIRIDERSAPAPAPEISVIVPTFRRVALLARLLDALAEQRGVERFETIVVDNSPERGAEQPVSTAAATLALDIRYVHEPRSGISHARNAGVAAARGQLIALIDDDEIPGADWLASLVSTRHRYDADVVMGPVRPVGADGYVRDFLTYDAGARTGDRLCLPFTRNRHGGTRRRHPLASHNTLVKRECFAGEAPFDPRLGRTGGEDSLFFAALYFAGRKFVWSAEAAVQEEVPPERTNPAYLLERAFRNGQITSMVCVRLRPRRLGWLALWMGVGLLQVAAGAAIVAVSSGDRRLRGSKLVRGGLGKLLWMERFRRETYGGGTSADPVGAVPERQG